MLFENPGKTGSFVYGKFEHDISVVSAEKIGAEYLWYVYTPANECTGIKLSGMKALSTEVEYAGAETEITTFVKWISDTEVLVRDGGALDVAFFSVYTTQEGDDNPGDLRVLSMEEAREYTD